jgi:serine/threonine-protein kinase RsbW
MGSETEIRCRFDATFEDVSQQIVRLGSEIKGRGLRKEQCESALIVIGEVLNNIVEHAYGQRAGGTITLTASVSAERIRVTTLDHGMPLPNGPLGRATMPSTETERDDLPEGGFGWFIIHTLTQDMSYERIEGQNQFSFSVEA